MRTTISVVVALCWFAMTYLQVRRIDNIHHLKNEHGYNFDDADLKFETTGKIVKLALFCFIAAILCGCTGIAGGMVLGPLFLSYNMLPSVMSGTNQYITMIAALSTAAQFIYIGDMMYAYAGLFALLTLISAFCGLKAINAYTAKSGKESIIAIILVIVLTLALLGLPLNYLIKSMEEK